MNTNVTFETSKLLKEKGFVQGFSNRQKFYFPDTKELTENHRGNNYPAPTIAEACMWLYEKHGIWIEVYYDDFKKEFYIVLDGEEFKFNSPTEAYQEAISYTLKNLIK